MTSIDWITLPLVVRVPFTFKSILLLEAPAKTMLVGIFDTCESVGKENPVLNLLQDYFHGLAFSKQQLFLFRFTLVESRSLAQSPLSLIAFMNVN